MRNILISTAVSGALLLTGCAPQKIDIQQGNVVTTEMLNQLKVGMDKRQVRYVMGTPLLGDPFHRQRWDYYYSYKPGGKATTRYRATLYFDGTEHLAKVDRVGPIPPNDSGIGPKLPDEDKEEKKGWSILRWIGL